MVKSREWMTVAAVLVALSGTAQAELGPTLDHHPITDAPAHQPLAIQVHIVSNTNFPVYKPTVYVRPAGMTTFTRIDLAPLAGIADIYTATIPGDLVNDGLDYYIEAFDKDGNGPGRTGSSEAPLHVRVTTAGTPPLVVMEHGPSSAPAAAAPAPAPAVVSSAPAATSSRMPNEVLLGVGGAAAVAGAVTLGIGLNSLYSWQQDSERATLHVDVGRDRTPSQLSSEHSSANATVTIGSALIGAGVIAAAVGVYLYLTPSEPSSGPAVAQRAEAERNPKLASLLLDF